MTAKLGTEKDHGKSPKVGQPLLLYLAVSSIKHKKVATQVAGKIASCNTSLSQLIFVRLSSIDDRSDSVLGTVYHDSLQAKIFKTLMTSLFEDICLKLKIRAL